MRTSVLCVVVLAVLAGSVSAGHQEADVRRFRDQVSRLSAQRAANKASPTAADATAAAAPAPQQAPAPNADLEADATAYQSFLEQQAFVQAQAYADQQAAVYAQAKANAEAWQAYMNTQQPVDQASATSNNNNNKEEEESTDTTSFVETGAQAKWGFGRGFQPQLYGFWQQKEGNWNFGSDKRIECEACTYVTYMLIDRLGDQFNREIIKQEAEGTCARVQWVFKSACDFVLNKNLATVSDLVMKLIEPHDVCKHLDLCQPDMMDLMGFGGMNGFSPTRLGITLPPSVRARMADMRMGKGSGSGSGSGSGAAPSAGGMMGMMSGFNRPGLYGMQTLPYGQLPLGLQPLSPQDLYGMHPGAFFGGGKGSGSGAGSGSR